MSAELDTIEESIKIALDAADAATDITSEYNKVKREHKKLEAKVKQIHRYTTIIFGSSILASVVAIGFSSVLYFKSMSDLSVMTTTNREALVIFAENVDALKETTNEQLSGEIANFSGQLSSTVSDTLVSQMNGQLAQIESLINGIQDSYSNSIEGISSTLADNKTMQSLADTQNLLSQQIKLLEKKNTEMIQKLQSKDNHIKFP